MSKLYILRVRQQDGSWSWQIDEPMTKNEATKAAQQMRVLFGISSQVWKLSKAQPLIEKENLSAHAKQ